MEKEKKAATTVLPMLVLILVMTGLAGTAFFMDLPEALSTWRTSNTLYLCQNTTQHSHRPSLNLSINSENQTINLNTNTSNIHIVCSPQHRPSETSLAEVATPELRILIGVLTRADLYERRQLIRMVYGIQKTEKAQVDVRFVFCRLYKDDQRILIPLEILRYNDIMIVDCEENMDSGKTYTYFSSLPKMDLPKYDYVMKVDDDAYFRFDALAEALGSMPRNDSYFGMLVPCHTEDLFHRHYMSGMGYALSWDLVEWISESPDIRNHTKGPEDRLVSEWLDMAGKGRNRKNGRPQMYDLPGLPQKCSHDFTPDTIAVHKLKSRDHWFRTLNYFNVTASLKL